MIGLLLKDIKLMKMQRNFFLIIIAVAAVFTFYSSQSTFAISYLTIVFSLFTITTLSYDEADNASAFLMCLPVSRKDFAVEKYLLGFLLVAGSWIISIVLSFAGGLIRNDVACSEILVTAFTTLSLMLVMQAVMLPLALKYGAEKGRIALFGVFGAGFLILYFGSKLAEAWNLDIAGMFNRLSDLSWGILLAAVTVLALILYLLSMRLSISIMEKKEF